MVELSVFGQLEVQDVTTASDLAESTLTLRIDRADSEPIGETVRSLYLLFQVVDAARMVCDSVVAERGWNDAVNVSSPRVRALTKTNPVEIVLAGSLPVLGLTYALVKIWSKIRSTEASASLTDANAGLVDAQAGLVESQADMLREKTRELRIANDVPNGRPRH